MPPRRRVYGCTTTYERKGAAVCPNAIALPMVETDQALLDRVIYTPTDGAVEFRATCTLGKDSARFPRYKRV